jgi:hypothetical protein
VVAKEHLTTSNEPPRKPLLLVDIDGVVSLFGTPDGAGSERADAEEQIEGAFHAIDGIPHFLSSTAAAHLLGLRHSFELVWASGWEEKAEEHLPRLLGLPAALPYIAFSEQAPLSGRNTHAHWKLTSISDYAGERPLAWVDDAFNTACHEWADARGAPTLLVSTLPARGLTRPEAQALLRWAGQLQTQP